MKSTANVVRAAAMSLILSACGGGGGDSGHGPAHLVEHAWAINAEKVDGAQEVIVKPETSIDTEVYAFANLGPLITYPAGELGGAIAEVYATAAGDVYWVSTQAPVGDLSDPASVVGNWAYLIQSQVFRKTADGGGSLDLVISQATVEALDKNPHEPTTLECKELSTPGASVATHCSRLINGTLIYVISAWKDVPIKDKDGNVTGNSQVELAFGAVDASLWGWINHWQREVGPDVRSNLRFKVVPDFEYDPDVDKDADGTDDTHARLRLNRPTVVSIPLDAVGKDQEFTVWVQVIASATNRRQGESFIGARFRDPQKLSGITYLAQGVELVSVPAGTVSTPPAVSVQPAPACASGPSAASGTLQFKTASIYAPEASTLGTALVWVTRSGGAQGEVSVLLATQDGGAHSGTDYHAVSTLVRFDDGEQGSRFVAMPIVDNKLVDGDRTVMLTLSDVRGCATLGAPASAVLTILDDDHPPPSTTFALGGSVTGLVGAGLVLRNSSGEQVQPAGNGAFTFPTRQFDGFGYNVTVVTQPTNPIQICAVANGSGTIASADVTDIAVNCTTPLPNGSLDATFGSGGKVATGIVGAPSAMALQADGRIVMLGGLKLLRFNGDGTADTGFGNGGQASVPFNNSVFDTALGLAVQSDGSIVVVGFTSIANQDDFALARFNADGTLDSSFGTGGKVTTDFAGSGDQAHRVAIQNDGKIVVAGYATSGSGASADADFAVARYNSNGTLDTSFGGSGKVRTNVAGKFDSAQGLILQTDGKVVLVGRVGVDGGSDPDFGVVRYDADGTLDNGFGAAGIVRTDFGLGNWEEANDVAVQADGRIVIAGRVRVGATFNFALARLNVDGTPDAAFGTGGLVTTAFSTQGDSSRALALQADGKIVVVGQGASLGTNPDMAIARYRADGSLDAAFGSAGKVTVDFFSAIDGAEGVVIQADGKIVVGGFARNAGTTGFALARVAP